MGRAQVVILAGGLAVCLIAGSPQRLIGDGREYLAQAIEFASFRGPAFRPGDIPHVQAELARFDPGLANWDIWSSTVADVIAAACFSIFGSMRSLPHPAYG